MSTVEEKTHEETWTYAGRRLSRTDTILYAFEMEDGTVRHYKKRIAHVSIGRRIIVTVVDEDRSYYTAGPLGPRIADSILAENDPKLVGWVAKDEETAAEKNRLSALKASAKDQPIMDLTVRELLEGARRLPRHQARALLVWFADEVYA